MYYYFTSPAHLHLDVDEGNPTDEVGRGGPNATLPTKQTWLEQAHGANREVREYTSSLDLRRAGCAAQLRLGENITFKKQPRAEWIAGRTSTRRAAEACQEGQFDERTLFP